MDEIGSDANASMLATLLGSTGSGGVVVGGVIAAAWFLHKLWLSAKGDRMDSGAASRIDAANQALIEQLRGEIDRLYKMVGEYRDQLHRCETEIRKSRALNDRLLSEVNALRRAARLPQLEPETDNDPEIN